MIRSPLFRRALGFAMLAVAVGVASASADNLLKNPSFESRGDGGVPSDWVGNSQVYGVDAAVHRDGKASLRYQNMDPKRYVICTQPARVKPGSLIRFGGWVKTRDVAGDDTGATFCLEWADRSGKYLGGSYPGGVKGTRDWTRVEAVARVPDEAGSVVVGCYLRQHMTGTAWFDDVTVERVKPSLLDTVLLSPAYRGRITAEGPKEIRVRARMNLADYDVAPRDTRLAIVLCDGAKKELHGRKDITAPEPSASSPAGVVEIDLVLPIGELSPGIYDLEVRASKASGDFLAASCHRLERMADDFKPRCAIDAHRRLLVDGRPFFPIGMYWHGINPKDIEVFADSKFNCLMPYHSPSIEQMDLAWKHHLRVLYSVKDCFLGTVGCPASVHNEAEEEQWVRSRFRTFRDHPALLAWYLNDELPLSYLPRLVAHQHWAMEEDPHHPTWIVLCEPLQIHDYRNGFDVIGSDPYPIGHSATSTVARWTAETFNQVDRARAVWQVPQVFNWANYEKNPDGKKPLRTPTVDEIRSMAWQCIAEGATGLVFYSWSDLKRNADVPFETLWPGIKDVAAEVDRAAPALLSIEPSPEVTAADAKSHEPPRWLHFTVRRHQGKVYLFAVNDGDGEGRARFRVDAPIGRVRDIRSKRDMPVANNAFEDDFKKLQVSIYEIETSPETACTDQGHAAAFLSVEASTSLARRRADAGAVATVAEYVYRPMKETVELLRKDSR